MASNNDLSMGQDDLVVFKLDCDKRFSYCNDAFMEYSGFYEEEILGQPYELITHDDMPKALARRMWRQLESEDEFLIYVKSRRKDGGAYWSLGNVSATRDIDNRPVGYLSVRRHAREDAVQRCQQLYLQMCEAEQAGAHSEASLAASEQLLDEAVATEGGYDEFVCSYIK